jgi:hypothetical protein
MSPNGQPPYERGHYVEFARNVGRCEDEIRRIVRGPKAAGWHPLGAMLLRAADELHHCFHSSTMSSYGPRFGGDVRGRADWPESGS